MVRLRLRRSPRPRVLAPRPLQGLPDDRLRLSAPLPGGRPVRHAALPHDQPGRANAAGVLFDGPRTRPVVSRSARAAVGAEDAASGDHEQSGRVVAEPDSARVQVVRRRDDAGRARGRKGGALFVHAVAGFENEFNELKQVHEQLAYELLAGRKLEEYKVELQKELNDLYGILHHVGVLRESSHCMKDYILAKGDILASLLFSKLFDQAEWHDSRNFMLTDGNFGAPEVLWEESCRAARQEFRGLRGMAVVPGYCGKTEAGYTISMGRVGLSLTAAVLEAAFQQVKVA